VTPERKRILLNLQRYEKKLVDAIRLFKAEADNDPLVVNELSNTTWGLNRWSAELQRLMHTTETSP